MTPLLFLWNHIVTSKSCVLLFLMNHEVTGSSRSILYFILRFIELISLIYNRFIVKYSLYFDKFMYIIVLTSIQCNSQKCICLCLLFSWDKKQIHLTYSGGKWHKFGDSWKPFLCVFLNTAWCWNEIWGRPVAMCLLKL